MTTTGNPDSAAPADPLPGLRKPVRRGESKPATPARPQPAPRPLRTRPDSAPMNTSGAEEDGAFGELLANAAEPTIDVFEPDEVDPRVKAITVELGLDADPDDVDDEEDARGNPGRSTIEGTRVPEPHQHTHPATAPPPAPPPSGVSPAGAGPLADNRISEQRDASGGKGNVGDGRYTVKSELARGGMGAILLARDHDLRRHVAMKVLLGVSAKRMQEAVTRRRVERFLSEAQITGQLDHPNIVPVHEIGIDGRGRPWFTMKLVRGEALSDIIRKQREHSRGRRVQTRARRTPGARPSVVWPRSRLLEVFNKLCDAVAYAHSRGVVHRDLKPENVMVGAFGEVLVMDWGIARVVATDSDTGEAGRKSRVSVLSRPRSDATSARRNDRDDDDRDDRVVQTLRSTQAGTLEGSVMGTPAYMAPEQAAGGISRIDRRTDVYALGAILYEILTLTPAWNPDGNEDAGDIVRRIQQGEQPESPMRRAPGLEIPPELDAICTKAMSTDPDDRYATVDALQNDVRAWADGTPVSVWRDTPWQLARKWAQRNRVAAVAAAAALVVAISVIVSLMSALSAAEVSKRAEQQRAQTEAEATQLRLSRLTALAEARRYGEMRELLGVRVAERRDQVRQEFISAWDHRATRRSDDDDGAAFLRALDPATVQRYIVAFENAIKVHDQDGSEIADASDSFYLGVLYGAADQPMTAIRWFTRCLKEDPEHMLALDNRGVMYLRLDRPDDAMADFSRATIVAPDHPTGWFNWGRMQIDQSAAKAEPKLTRAVELAPDVSTFRMMRGVARLRQGHLTTALSDFEAAIDMGDVRAYCYRGQLRRVSGDRAGALDDFTRTLQALPDHTEALNDRAVLRREMGDYRGAVDDLERLVGVAPDNWTAWANLGVLRLEFEGNKQGGIDAFIRAWRICKDPVMKGRIADNIRVAGGKVPGED
ncbi:MAG: protein kinase [Planctomycetota bacterium]